MSTPLDDTQLKEALDRCASEPVHIPGIIQPAGFLLAINSEDARIDYISANAEAVFGAKPQDLLGSSAQTLFGDDFWHNLNNVSSFPSFATSRERIDTVELNDAVYEVSSFTSGDHIVLELEKTDQEPLEQATLRQLAYLTREIQSCELEQDLLDLNTSLMRRLTGYDRVMAYRFDKDHAGEVVSESLQGSDEPYIGLRFPSWDIPAQAREIMRTVPLRYIIDTHQTPVPILARNPDTPLDITQAHLRGVSEIHLQYLRNMGTRATMTLSIVVDGKLWGMISFHAKHPKVPTHQQQQLLTAFKPILEGKLSALLLKDQLNLSDSLEALRTALQPDLQADDPVVMALPNFAPKLLSLFKADGVIALAGHRRTQYGQVPEDNVIQAILDDARDRNEQLVTSDNLPERFPELVEAANGIAGYLAASFEQDHAILIFKVEREQKVRWAGAPDKTIEISEGQARLEPRGSFSLYMETIRGRSEPWDTRTLNLVDPLCSWLRSSEALAQSKTIGRQQTLVIDELNHRVRNILALIRSVSRQARKEDGVQYAEAMEARILTLTDAYDLGINARTDALAFQTILAVETKPYADANSRVILNGPDFAIRADLAPILALIIHELVTNAAKYGAFAHPDGIVRVEIHPIRNGVEICWKETGGGPVNAPERRGFGSKLIERAVPHELGGTANLSFEPDGLRATIWLPNNTLADMPQDVTVKSQSPSEANSLNEVQNLDPKAAILIVEDNYILSSELSDLLAEMGFENIATAGNLAQAAKSIAKQTPDLAILDVNLGAQETTFDVARQLRQSEVPIIFATGYGSRYATPKDLSDIMKLTKPITIQRLEAAIAELLGSRSREADYPALA